MKKSILLLLFITIFSCNKEQKDYALLSGTIINTTSKKAMLVNGDFKQEITIADDGTFSDTLKLAETGFFNLSIDRERIPMYIKNGTNISISVDVKALDESIKYSGIGSAENNYLASKFVANKNAQEDQKMFFSVDETTFKTNIEELKSKHLAALNDLKDVDQSFITTETKNITYDMYMMLSNYPKAHPYFTKKKEFKVSDEFTPVELKNIVFDNAEDYKMSESYKQLAIDNSLDAVFNNLDNSTKAKPEDLKVISDIQIPALKDDVINYAGIMLLSPANENMGALYDFFMANTSKEDLKEKLATAYEKNKNLLKGMPSPKFVNYENHKGGTTSLDDLKGKYVYVDVWATWCGPCIGEIPSLKSVEKQFHGKNIEFVSASIDTKQAHAKWVSMINEKELGGIQVIADNDWKSQFVQDYAIDGIPRFILIDPQGNIVSADAPRPSNPELVELFKELKI